MHYVILDLEWNVPAAPIAYVETPVRLSGEIIQIGAVKLDEAFQPIDLFKLNIAPTFYTKMNENVATLTHINEEILHSGIPFPQAFSLFQEWCGKDFAFLTWGTEDIPMLEKNMLVHGIDLTWSFHFYDLQKIFDWQITREDRPHALSFALEKLNETGLPAHDALHDAINAFRVCRHLNMHEGITSYRAYLAEKETAKRKRQAEKRKKKRIMKIGSGSPWQKQFGVTYPNKRTAKKDQRVSSFACPVCKRTILCKKWTVQNSDRSISWVRCPNGEEFLVRLHFIKTASGNIRVNRIIHPITEENRTYFQELLKRKKKKSRWYKKSNHSPKNSNT